MKRYIIFIVTFCLIIAAMFSCKDDPVKPVTPPQDTTKTDSSSKNGTKPKIISFSPEKGFDESIVVITGKNFGTDTSKFNVYFDLKKCQKIKLTWDSTNSFLTVKLPAKSKTSKFTIFRGDSSDESKKEFPVVPFVGVEVLLNNAYPRSGCSGEHFYIKGRNLDIIRDDLKLFMGGIPLIIENFTDSLITTRFVGKGQLSIKSYYSGHSYESFNYGDPCLSYLVGDIKIVSVNKLMARQGDTIAILCNYFGSEQKPKVYFGNVEAVVLSTSNAFYHHVWKNSYTAPEHIFVSGNIVCIIPPNPDPLITVVGNCGTASYKYEGFGTPIIKSAHFEISNVKCTYFDKKPSSLDTIEYLWNRALPVTSVSSINNQTQTAIFSSSSKTESILENTEDSSRYELNLKDITDITIYKSNRRWYSGNTGYSYNNSTFLKFKNVKKILEDDNQIIYELRGNDIVTNAIEVNDYSTYSKILGGGYIDFHFMNFLEQTNDSYIRFVIHKK